MAIETKTLSPSAGNKQMKVVLTYHHPSGQASAFCSSLLADTEDDVPGDWDMAYRLKSMHTL